MAYFDNSGDSPLQVPGIGLSLYSEIAPGDRFSHGDEDWEEPCHITAREIAMLRLMEKITDRPDWHVGTHDDDVAVRWRAEASPDELINDKTWDWCLAELRDKATVFANSGQVTVLNVGSGISKSSFALSAESTDELRQATADMLSVMSERPKHLEHLEGNEKGPAVDLLDPTLYLLVYGRSRVLMQGGRVDLENTLDSYGRGQEAPVPPDLRESLLQKHVERFPNLVSRGGPSSRRGGASRGRGAGRGGRASRPRLRNIIEGQFRSGKFYRFSDRLQRLPCEARFTGNTGCEVEITSYVNNLHPTRHKAVYGILAQLITAAIEPWNQVLILGRKGRFPPRIRSYGVEWPNLVSNLPWDLERLDEDGDTTSDEYVAAKAAVQQYLLRPDDDTFAARIFPVPTADWWENWDWTRGEGRSLSYAAFEKSRYLDEIWYHPEPGVSFSYQEWKTGRNTGKPVIEKTYLGSKLPPEEARDPDHQYYTLAIQDEFREKGLQVVIGISGLELSPNCPKLAVGPWHTDGMLNDHIVAVAIYAFDVENVTELRLSFRQDVNAERWPYGPPGHDREFNSALAQVFAAQLDEDGFLAWGLPQELGSVAVLQGRLLAFPNTVERRLGPVSLVDPTRPGWVRFVTLALVDPHYRVCSTRNVPPQRHDWWADEALPATGLAAHGAPQEVVDLVDEATEQWPMGAEEAAFYATQWAREKFVSNYHPWTDSEDENESD